MQNVRKNLFLNPPAALAERGQVFLRLAYLSMNQRKIVQARSVLLVSEHCSADFERGSPIAANPHIFSLAHGGVA